MAETRTQTSRLWLWGGLVIVLFAVFFVARYFLRERLPVRAVQVERATLPITVPTNGHVEPIVNKQFYSPMATTVKAVYTQEGDTFHAGKLLITLDDVDARARVASAQSGVAAAQAALDAVVHNGTLSERQAAAAQTGQDRLARDQAKHDLDALTQLASTGAAAKGEITAAQERMQTAEANLEASEKSAQGHFSPIEVARAQAALSDAEAALAAAQHVAAQTTIVAPIAGTVYTLDAAPSEFAEAGKLLLEMADLRQERVRAYFDEPDLGHLATGQKVVIRWDARPGREWHGHISRLPATVVTWTTRNVGEALIDFDDSPDGLLPNTNVTVTVTISSEVNALSLPVEALHEQNGEYFVYKIVDGELKRTPVTIGTRNMTQAPVISGLDEGDWVATGTSNGQPLQEGIPIKEEK
jgi:HlyD family secretion protein